MGYVLVISFRRGVVVLHIGIYIGSWSFYTLVWSSLVPLVLGIHSLIDTNLVPRPHPLTRKNSLVNQVEVWEGIKPGTERSEMERNGTGSNCCRIRTWTQDMLWKIGVNMPGLSMYGELISRPVPATKTGQAPSRQYRAPPSI